PSYTPSALELRLRSRLTVLTDTPMVPAMKLSEHFLWSNTLIVYLCSGVNCLYIRNTKLVNPREGDESSPPFLYCLSYPTMLFGGFAPPAARQTSAVFFMGYSPRNVCTSKWKEQTMATLVTETAGLLAHRTLIFGLHIAFQDANTKKEDAPCGVSSL
ncbi:hypothetical protein SAMN04487825_1131, partial [Prevotella sp. kh1p2]